jgi:hypothetical protein
LNVPNLEQSIFNCACSKVLAIPKIKAADAHAAEGFDVFLCLLAEGNNGVDSVDVVFNIKDVNMGFPKVRELLFLLAVSDGLSGELRAPREELSLNLHLFN